MRFLADDLLEGRETGTRGFEIAASYVASQFEAAGLRRVGKSAFQTIPFRTARVTAQSMSINGTPLTPRTDFILQPDLMKPSVDITAQVALAGFGIVAPELHHDDYKMINVRGKIVLIVTGAPKGFPSDQRAYYSATTLKLRTAAKRGAIGVLMVSSNTDERRIPFDRRAQQDQLPSMRYIDERGRPADWNESLQVIGRLSQDTAGKLFEGAELSGNTMLREAEQNTTYAIKLKPTLTIHIASEFGDAKSANVVSVVRGSDPKLRDQYLVVSAHLDHLGNHLRPGTTDAIFNGAQDNASGVACLIEIARAIGARPSKRSILFVAFTGEEKGEQGSRFFVAHPPVPKTSIVADVNMDMPLLLYPLANVIALGGEHSTLGEHARRAAAAEELELSPDPFPEEVRFVRSDQFAFVERGIPAIHMKSGTKSADPAIDGDAVTREWLRRVYHSAADDMNQTLNFAAGARFATMNLRMIRAIADAPAKPKWYPGDFFGTLASPR